ncbi:hypothetical protein [Agrobacterium tumefaciens]|nr:hypothetical protein [Agrobacterium tumefaciens]
MFIGLIRFCALTYIVGAMGYFALLVVGFGVASMTQDDRPVRYLNEGYTR